MIKNLVDMKLIIIRIFKNEMYIGLGWVEVLDIALVNGFSLKHELPGLKIDRTLLFRNPKCRYGHASHNGINDRKWYFLG